MPVFLLMLGLAVLAILYVDANTRLVVERFTVQVEGLPKGLSGLKVVQLSDLHIASFGEENETLFSLVRAENPDLIALTGDLLEGRADTEAAERGYVEKTIPRLLDIAPVYFVTGNHEWSSPWVHDFLETLRDYGVTVLQNAYVLLSDGESDLVLCGLDDPNGRADMKKPRDVLRALREREGEKPILLLYHRNDKLSLWAELGIDVVLSGHAHGGLIRLPFTDGIYGPGRKLFPKNTSGLCREGKTTMLVSRGLGGIPLRFLNNPEILSLTLVA